VKPKGLRLFLASPYPAPRPRLTGDPIIIGVVATPIPRLSSICRSESHGASCRAIWRREQVLCRCQNGPRRGHRHIGGDSGNNRKRQCSHGRVSNPPLPRSAARPASYTATSARAPIADFCWSAMFNGAPPIARRKLFHGSISSVSAFLTNSLDLVSPRKTKSAAQLSRVPQACTDARRPQII
jgi:hypothetical protein